MAKIGLPKGSGKRLKVREKSVKSQGILKWILSGNPDQWFTRKCCLYFLSGALTAFCSAECNCLCNFSRQYYEEQFCEII